MRTYSVHTFRSVKTDTYAQASQIFARRIARRRYGARGTVHSITLEGSTEDESLAEFRANIGFTKGTEFFAEPAFFTIHCR